MLYYYNEYIVINNISQNLTVLLNKQNISVCELSHATGIPASTIKKMRSDSNPNPTLATLIPIAHFFSITLEDLIYGTKNHQAARWPLLTWEQIAQWSPSDETPIFTLRVIAEDWGIFLLDSILLINTTILPNHRDYIITIKKGQEKANIKQFLLDDENKYLKSLSISADIERMSDTYQIIGVITEYWKKLR